MDIDNSTAITTARLYNLEKQSGLVEVCTIQDFWSALQLDRAIIYLEVNWSGPERLSCYNVFRALSEINKDETALFKVDCSNQTKDYVINWLLSQKENQEGLYFGGWGETLLLEKGNIVDFIKNPGQSGLAQTKLKLLEWL